MNNKLQSIINQPIVYNVTEEDLCTLEGLYSQVPDVRTKDGYALAKQACSELRTLRTSIEKGRKELKADALEYGKQVDIVAKKITDRIVKLEDPIKSAKEQYDAEIEAEKERKRQAELKRIADIREKIDCIKRMAVMMPGYTAAEVSDAYNFLNELEITEAEYMELATEAESARVSTLEILDNMMAQIAERERVAEEERQRLEAQRIEAARVAEVQRIERERLDAERAALESTMRAERERQEKERAAIEEERRIEREKHEAEIAEERARMAAERAEFEAERERQRIEKEEQEAARKAQEAEEQEAERQRYEVETPVIVPGAVIDDTETVEDLIGKLAAQLQRYTTEVSAVEIAFAIIEGKIDNVKYEAEK